MTPEELNKAIQQLKSEGHTDEEILGGFYKMFQNDELTIDELEGITNAMGYHFTDDFKAMSPEDQKTKGYRETEDEAAEGVTQKEVDDAKEVDSDSEEDEDEPKGNPVDNKKPKDDDDSDKEDEDEKERAMKLFGD